MTLLLAGTYYNCIYCNINMVHFTYSNLANYVLSKNRNEIKIMFFSGIEPTHSPKFARC